MSKWYSYNGSFWEQLDDQICSQLDSTLDAGSALLTDSTGTQYDLSKMSIEHISSMSRQLKYMIGYIKYVILTFKQEGICKAKPQVFMGVGMSFHLNRLTI
jgi:hypothetical protein